MKKNLRNMILMLLALVMCLISVPSFAEEAEVTLTPTVNLDVAITLEGTLPSKPETFVVRMTAENGGPMPAEGDVYDLQIKGAGEASFPEIVCDRRGVYNYTIVQLPGKDDEATYDSTVYHMTISVVNEGDGLAAIVALNVDGVEAKPEDVKFHNVYPIILPPGEVTPTGVQDKWPWYLAGCALMLTISAAMIVVLRRKEEQAVAVEGADEITDQDLEELYQDLNEDLYEIPEENSAEEDKNANA